MFQKGLFMKILILILLLLFSSPVSADPVPDIPPVYQPLFERLSKDGFDCEFLSKLFTDDRAEVIPDRRVISLGSKESEELYAQFLSPESILLSKKFLLENDKFLNEVERRFNVEKEVIVAILLVESRFGENTGKHRVIPTLASMAVMDTPDNLQSNFLFLKEIEPELTYEWVENRA